MQMSSYKAPGGATICRIEYLRKGSLGWYENLLDRGVSVAECDVVFFFQAEDGIRDLTVTGVQTCALPICRGTPPSTTATCRSTSTREGRPAGGRGTSWCRSRTSTTMCRRSGATSARPRPTADRKSVV